ncbi:MAG: hypothetical protein WA842_06265 [Croceibacterium sp.]
MRKLFLGAAAASLIVAGTAQAAPVARSATPVSASEAMGGNSAHLWLGLLGAALLGIVLWQINDDDVEALPHSP